MSKKNNLTGKRQFIHLKEAWYSESVLRCAGYMDEVSFGLYDDDGGTSGEMSFRWYSLGWNKPLAPKLECFDDAFKVLGSFNDVIEQLASMDHTKSMTPQEFMEILKFHDFKDVTPKKNPRG